MSVVSAPPATTVRAARTAVFAAFAINGAAFAAFASRVPDIKHGLGLSAGALGLTLLAASLGSVIGLPLSGWIVHRLGAARTLMGAAIIQSVGLVGVGIGVDVVGNRAVVMGGLVLVGIGTGVFDVAMNLEGAEVERFLGRAIMPHFHAAFSGGTVVSALIGAGLSFLHVPVAAHLLGVVVLLLARDPVVPAGVPAPIGGDGRDRRRGALRGRHRCGLARAAHAAHRRRRPRSRLHRGHGQRLGRGRALGRLRPRALGRRRGLRGLPDRDDRRAPARHARPRPARPRAGAPGPVRLGRRRLRARRLRRPGARLRRCGDLGCRCEPRLPGGDERRGRRPEARRGPDERRLDDRLHRVPRRPAAARLPRRPRRRAALAARRRRHGDRRPRGHPRRPRARARHRPGWPTEPDDRWATGVGIRSTR